MKRNFAYLKYITKAKGRHGIHSPFVYAFVEQILKKESRFYSLSAFPGFPVKKQVLILKTVGFLRSRVVMALSEDTLKLREVIAGFFPEIPCYCIKDMENADLNFPSLFLLSLRHTTSNELRFLENGKAHRLAVCFFDIAEDCNTAALWQRAKGWANYLMSLDMWHVGLLLQDDSFKSKQHFFIKHG